jgi:hypothetical protein
VRISVPGDTQHGDYRDKLVVGKIDRQHSSQYDDQLSVRATEGSRRSDILLRTMKAALTSLLLMILVGCGHVSGPCPNPDPDPTDACSTSKGGNE